MKKYRITQHINFTYEKVWVYEVEAEDEEAAEDIFDEADNGVGLPTTDHYESIHIQMEAGGKNVEIEEIEAIRKDEE
jgi:hypothetical protein